MDTSNKSLTLITYLETSKLELNEVCKLCCDFIAIHDDKI